MGRIRVFGDELNTHIAVGCLFNRLGFASQSDQSHRVYIVTQET